LNSFAWQAAAERSIDLSEHGHWTSIGHSAWGQTFSLTARNARYCVKTATGPYLSMLEAEADALRALAATQTIRVPQVAAQTVSGDTSILILEWLNIVGAPNGAALGHALAALHRAQPPCGPRGERFGWTRDNWIGGTPQHNCWTDDWCAFFREQRLAPQLTLAAQNGFGGELQRGGERLLSTLTSVLGNRDPEPSLLHGDLWSGNAAMLASGEAVIFDPAAYVGDREADLAMTTLFGGFDADFYEAYCDAWPLEAGYEIRRDVYNLYHVLNHLNLFGSGYLVRAERILARLVE
jgi:protein-ribulosamine 3-kinase